MKNKSLRITAIILIAQIVIMTIVYVFVEYSISEHVKSSAVGSMETISKERSQIIENYIEETENYLTAYSRAGEIAKLLKKPENPKVISAAQAYTETFSADRAYLEGIYVSEWNTHVLAHTNPKVVGITTREGESLQSLQSALLAADGVYNAGIVLSPASGAQVISIYRACYDEEKNPIGIVGGGIYTEGLVEILNSLPVEGMQQMKYYLVNVETGEYIFHEDAEQIATVAEETYIKTIIERLKNQKEQSFGSLNYENGEEEYLASYNYMENRGWVFVITDPASEVFASLIRMRQVLAVICIVGVLLLTIFTYKIIDRLIKSLQEVVETLDLCCNSMDERTDELYGHSDHLIDSVTENTAIIEELSASLESTENIVENVHDKVTGIDQWMSHTLSEMEMSMKSSEMLISSSREMMERAQNAYESVWQTFEETRKNVEDAMQRLEALSQINKMTDDIMDIAKQTNLLSFNASLEAARAGEAGKGFAVVVGEIGDLARVSTDSASDIQRICKMANENVEEVKNCFDTIMSFLEGTVMEQFKSFAQDAQQYSIDVDGIRQDIMRLNESTDILSTSLQQISDNVTAVKDITEENDTAIGEIARKNEDTSQIADKIQIQSDHNRELIQQLESIIQRFHMYTKKKNRK